MLDGVGRERGGRERERERERGGGGGINSATSSHSHLVAEVPQCIKEGPQIHTGIDKES